MWTERPMRWGKTLLGRTLPFLFTENRDQMPSTTVSDVTLDLQQGLGVTGMKQSHANRQRSP